MVDRLFSDGSYVQMKRALDVEAARHSVIAHNIANVNTPGYKAKRLTASSSGSSRFSHHLSQAESRRTQALALARLGSEFAHPGHIEFDSGAQRGTGEQSAIAEDGSATPRNDGNTVDIYREMALLAETQMRYEALAQMVSGRLITLRKVISEGRI